MEPVIAAGRLWCRVRAMNKLFFSIFASLVLVAALLTGGCHTAYYSAMETFGVYKRDLLKKRVVAARDDQKVASEQFKDALTRLKEMYGFDGGNLEKTYSGMNKDYERSSEKAEAVKKRIRDVETVAKDLFAEWEKEICKISFSHSANKSFATVSTSRIRFFTASAFSDERS